jgi:cell division protein ZapA (FtsZ GTPase activity inhibitor)
MDYPLDINKFIEIGDEMNIQVAIDYAQNMWEQVKQAHRSETDTQRICILTAVKIADEMIKFKNLQEDISGKCEKKLNELIKHLDDVHSKQ